MKKLQRYRFFFIFALALLLITFMNHRIGTKAMQLTGQSIFDMLLVLPPIFILVGLLDQWVKKETLIRFMGEKSGFYGIFFTLVLATVAAGPLYLAFPIAVLLLEKGASVRNMVFFLGAWSTVKIPVLVYEFTSFGSNFTLIHICFSLVFYYLSGILFEKIYNKEKLLKYNLNEEVLHNH